MQVRGWQFGVREPNFAKVGDLAERFLERRKVMSEVRADSSTKKGIYMGQLGEDLTEAGSECNLQEIQVSG